MANVKAITVKGMIPFTCDRHPRMSRYLAELNAPAFGLRIAYGDGSFVPNKDMPLAEGSPEGKTLVYEFAISGEEAVSPAYVNEMMQAVVDCGGTVTEASCFDVEANEKVRLTLPTGRTAITVVGVYFEANAAGCYDLTILRGRIVDAVDVGLFEHNRKQSQSGASLRLVDNSVRIGRVS